MDKISLIERLQLTKHPKEGGYFRRTYESPLLTTVDNRERKLLTSIFYMLTSDSPLGYLHRNRSDIIHYYQMGASSHYVLISPEGDIHQPVLGPNLESGEVLQLTVPGGWWKGSRLLDGEFSLISEAVAPGFDYRDNELAMSGEFASLPKDQLNQILPYLKDKQAG